MRPRASASAGKRRHHRLYDHGKGGTEREVPVPAATQEALEAWLAAHPLRRGASGLRDEAALHKLLRRWGRAAGVPERLSHPHALRAYYATTLAAEGVPVHVIAARLGHAEIQTTSRYLPSSPTTAPRWARCSIATTTRSDGAASPPDLVAVAISDKTPKLLWGRAEALAHSADAV